jgi:hypothetical protein
MRAKEVLVIPNPEEGAHGTPYLADCVLPRCALSRKA